MSRALFPAWKTYMLKLTFVIMGVALAGTASAAGWRSMRIDASSEASFNESVAALQDKLPRVRRRVLEQSLQDIWAQGMQAAVAAEREYTRADYLKQLDGLKYQDVVTFTDPSGDRAQRYFDQAYARLFPQSFRGVRMPNPRGIANSPRPMGDAGRNGVMPPNPLDR